MTDRPICELYGTEIIPKKCRRDCCYAEYDDDEDGFYCTYTQDGEDESLSNLDED